MYNFLRKHYWRIVFAVTIGAMAFLIVSPAFAALQPSNAATPVIEAAICETRVDSLDPTNLVTVINIERHIAFDAIRVFLVEVTEGDWRYVTVTSKNGCIVGMGM